MREEEVTILFIVCSTELKIRCLRTAFTVDAVCRTLLLAYDRLYLKFTKLHICSKAKKAADTGNKTDIAGERDITCFYKLDYFVFLSVVFEFKVLSIVVKSGLCVVI